MSGIVNEKSHDYVAPEAYSEETVEAVFSGGEKYS